MLDGHVVLITGAGRGIGRGIALASAARGAHVVVTALTRDEADVVVEEIRALGGSATPAVCDVTSSDSIAAAIADSAARLRRIDCIVHNATSRFSPIFQKLEQITDEHWDDLVAVGATGAYLMASLGKPHLEASGGSLLLLISNAAYHGTADMPAYSAVKGALRGMVKALAREWGPYGIRVNGLSPVAMTPAMEEYLHRYPEEHGPLLDRAALRRFGDPENDIGAAATMLIRPDARFVTGQTLVVDGGGVMP